MSLQGVLLFIIVLFVLYLFINLPSEHNSHRDKFRASSDILYYKVKCLCVRKKSVYPSRKSLTNR